MRLAVVLLLLLLLLVAAGEVILRASVADPREGRRPVHSRGDKATAGARTRTWSVCSKTITGSEYRQLGKSRVFLPCVAAASLASVRSAGLGGGRGGATWGRGVAWDAEASWGMLEGPGTCRGDERAPQGGREGAAGLRSRQLQGSRKRSGTTLKMRGVDFAGP